MQTKKTFIATAATLKAKLDAATCAEVRETLTALAHEFADGYGRDNSRFDRARFLKACGL